MGQSISDHFKAAWLSTAIGFAALVYLFIYILAHFRDKPIRDKPHLPQRKGFYHYAIYSGLVDSNQFYIRSGHQNPIQFPFKTHIYTSDLGWSIGVGYEAKNKFTDFKEITSDERPDHHNIKLHAGMYYHCENVCKPEVRDIRVQFSYAGLQDHQYTTVGQQVKGTIRPFHTLEGHVLLVFKGALTLDEAFKVEHSERRLTAWGFRGAGWFLLFLASSCLIRLLHVICKYIIKNNNIDTVKKNTLTSVCAGCGTSHSNMIGSIE